MTKYLQNSVFFLLKSTTVDFKSGVNEMMLKIYDGLLLLAERLTLDENEPFTLMIHLHCLIAYSGTDKLILGAARLRRRV